MAARADEENTLPPNGPIIISTGEALSLLRALITLKLLHAIAFLFRLDKSRKRPLKSPVTRAVVRREQLIIDVFLSVMPESVFRSPTVPDGIEMAQFPSVDGPADEGWASSDVQSPLIHTSPGIPTVLRRWQCGSSRSVEPLPSSPTLPESAHVASESSSAQQLLLRPSEDDERRNLSVTHAGSLGINQESASTLNPEYAAFKAERQQLSAGGRPWPVDSVGLPLTDSSRAILEMGEGTRPSQSAESYLGRFSISEWSYGNTVSMAPYCMTGRNATSVRPFSDL
ncbi:hypothetical protein BDV26DRAFT_303488 [Aspergillus bertholletiae]|uniref:Uncharacterized protein n=1 Tax=Aspergillus bertholletiae TaxID=1226010 RepID=A0A5N7BD85_9EURO|nr:hypothetical protein BDV26DRAFT_303488 [Aspergillus bertholletiae]